MFVSSEFRQRFRGREETLRGIAAQELASMADPADGEPRTYYFVFDTPRPGADRVHWRAAIRRLKDRYSAVVFVELLADDELVLAELQSLRPLRDLLDRGYRVNRDV